MVPTASLIQSRSSGRSKDWRKSTLEPKTFRSDRLTSKNSLPLPFGCNMTARSEKARELLDAAVAAEM